LLLLTAKRYFQPVGNGGPVGEGGACLGRWPCMRKPGPTQSQRQVPLHLLACQAAPLPCNRFPTTLSHTFSYYLQAGQPPGRRSVPELGRRRVPVQRKWGCGFTGTVLAAWVCNLCKGGPLRYARCTLVSSWLPNCSVSMPVREELQELHSPSTPPCSGTAPASSGSGSASARTTAGELARLSGPKTVAHDRNTAF